MVIALLAVLGVDLIVLVVFVGAVLARRRWVSHQPGSFKGVAHLTAGELHPFGKRARRGYGRWVRDVLVWTPGPLCLRNALMPVDRIADEHAATGKVKRLGDDPAVVVLVSGDARLEVTVAHEDVPLAKGAFEHVSPSDGR